MSPAIAILSRLFGAFWLVFGLNGLFHFFPVPPPPAASAYFTEALVRSGYVMPLLYGTEVAAGLMLILDGWRPLALLLLAPITAHIILYNMVLNPAGLGIGIAIAITHVLLLWKSRKVYAPLLQCRY